MKNLAHIFFAIVFFAQTTAPLYGVETLQSKQIMQDFVEEYNKLSSDQRHEMVAESVKLRPLNDQIVMTERLKAIKTLSLPDLSLTGDKISFEWMKNSYDVIVDESTVAEVNGTKIDFGLGSMASALDSLDKLLTSPKVSFSDLFIAQAYAASSETLLVAAGAIAAIVGLIIMSVPLLIAGGVVAFTGLFSYQMKIDMENKFGSFCDDAVKKAKNVRLSASKSEQEALLQMIKKNQKKLATDVACKNSDRKAHCLKVKKCLNKLESEFNSPLAAINDSQNIKDQPGSNKQKLKEKSSNQ